MERLWSHARAAVREELATIDDGQLRRLSATLLDRIW